MTNYYSGFIVGITQTAIGHPLDTMKVIYQNNPNADSKLMNIRNLYRGWKFPLLASTTFNGSIFNMHDYFKSKNIRLGNNDNGFLAGSLAGLIISPYVYFINKGKVLQQTNRPITGSNILTKHGIGVNATKETLATGVYFSSYETYKTNLGLPVFAAGGLAGLTMWTSIYPLDTLRTRQFANSIGFKEALKQGNLWKGYSVCATRSVVTNAFNFYVYELCNKYFSKN